MRCAPLWQQTWHAHKKKEPCPPETGRRIWRAKREKEDPGYCDRVSGRLGVQGIGGKETGFQHYKKKELVPRKEKEVRPGEGVVFARKRGRRGLIYEEKHSKKVSRVPTILGQFPRKKGHFSVGGFVTTHCQQVGFKVKTVCVRG